MSAASLVDYLTEKFYYFSSKMRGDSFQPSSTSFLMNGNKHFPHCDPSSILTEIKDKSDYHIALDPSYQAVSSLRFASGFLGNFRQIKGFDKPSSYPMDYNSSKGFSSYLFNFVSDPYRPKYLPFDSPLFYPQNNIQTAMMEGVLNESHVINQKTKTMNENKVCDPEITKIDVSRLHHKEKSVSSTENCDLSRTMKLNIELAHRKTKEMSKRSKRRRRRQKKCEQITVSNSASASDDDDSTNTELPSRIADSVCILSESPDFGCTLSVKHTVQLSPCRSFFIPATSNSEDDSEWEAFDEVELSAANNDETDCIRSATFKSSPVKCKSFKSVDCRVQISSVISFVVPEDDSSDDSDWDTCETNTFPECTGLELSGLYFTELCTPLDKKECNYESNSEEDCEEALQLRAILEEANNKWDKLDESHKPKSASKVTFAPDDNLVEVFPVEAFDRKGEWEMYATERLRFKRKIEELEKIISPCLTSKHRSKIFKYFVEPKL